VTPVGSGTINAPIKRKTVTVTTDSYGQIFYSALGIGKNNCLSVFADGDTASMDYALVKCGNNGFRVFTTNGSGGLTHDYLVTNTSVNVTVFYY
jgi:hypothetical protein